MTHLLRLLWAAPCSALGLALSLPMLMTGARIKCIQGVLEIAWPATAPQAAQQLPFTAITFGHVVLGTAHTELARLRAHEHAHVRQYERWGLLFLLLYPASSLWQLLRGRKVYWDNGFEVQARAQEQSSSRTQRL
jgi:hypothetical protein